MRDGLRSGSLNRVCTYTLACSARTGVCSRGAVGYGRACATGIGGILSCRCCRRENSHHQRTRGRPHRIDTALHNRDQLTLTFPGLPAADTTSTIAPLSASTPIQSRPRLEAVRDLYTNRLDEVCMAIAASRPTYESTLDLGALRPAERW